MVLIENGIKQCRLCNRNLPTHAFYKTRPGQQSSRCKRCHGLKRHRCPSCGRIFVGKAGRTMCSSLCRALERSPTYPICEYCGDVFGPVSHLSQRYCSTSCARHAAATGQKIIRRTHSKARSAQSLLRYYVQKGHIVRPSRCEQCGVADQAIEAAHYNYDEPLRVRWLCRPCHRRWDWAKPKGATYVVGVASYQTEKTPASAGVEEAGV